MSDDAGTDKEPRLDEVLPREQVGPATGERYDFQYHQAAAHSLDVLDDTKVACVYCEWHDDYVVEPAGVVCYRFHQVKTRSNSEGPWSVNSFFGTPSGRGRSKAGSPAIRDSPFARLHDHVAKFGKRCDCFVFVTDAGITTEFQTLLDNVRAASRTNDVASESSALIDKLHLSLAQTFSHLSRDALVQFIGRLSVQDAVGKLKDLKGCRTLIGGRIYEMSEVDLSMSEAQKIGDELVALVRDKSHRVLRVAPMTVAELRAAKGLVLDDVLAILSLSPAGYRELRASGRGAVVQLSRLHRLCKRSGVSDALIPDLCRLKTTWEAWWLQQRHNVNPLDYVALKAECAQVMRVHSAGQLPFDGVRNQARQLAAKHGAAFTSANALSDELVFGLMLSVAVEAEV